MTTPKKCTDDMHVPAMAFPLGPFCVLDGGLSSHLESLESGVCSGPLWGAELSIERPELVVEAHAQFLRAGSSVIATNTYQCHKQDIANAIQEIRSEPGTLYSRAVSLARDAIVRENREGLAYVAGSVGPYGACLRDGSEYSGKYIDQVSEQELEAWHEDRLRALAEAKVDLFAIETMPSLVEARAVLNALYRLQDIYQIPFWVSFQCQANEQSLTARGEPFSQAVKEVLNHPIISTGRLIAIGVNCVEPGFVSRLLEDANKVNIGNKGRSRVYPYVVYPNSGEDWNADAKEWSGRKDDSQIVSRLPDWVKLGASYFGGCCRVGPETINKVRQALLDSLSDPAITKTALKAGDGPSTSWQEVEANLRRKDVKTAKGRREEQVKGLDEIVEGIRLPPGLTSLPLAEDIMKAIESKYLPKE